MRISVWELNISENIDEWKPKSEECKGMNDNVRKCVYYKKENMRISEQRFIE